MKKLIVLVTLALGLAPIPAQSAAARCQAVANTVSQVPNGIEHFTKLHTTGFTTSCPPDSYIQISANLQQLQPDGSWTTIASETSPVKYVSPNCSSGACKTVSVTVEKDPCVDGTYRTVATGGNIALPPTRNRSTPTAIACYGDPAATPPTITSFTPTSGAVGQNVTIGGTNFSGVTAVAFNGTDAIFRFRSATKVLAKVPGGATSGTITLTTPGGTATSQSDFTVVP
jgi:IPT/TIG domain-containing protein